MHSTTDAGGKDQFGHLVTAGFGGIETPLKRYLRRLFDLPAAGVTTPRAGKGHVGVTQDSHLVLIELLFLERPSQKANSGVKKAAVTIDVLLEIHVQRGSVTAGRPASP